MRTIRTLATAALILSTAAAAQRTPVQTIALYSYGYAPNPIRLAAGRPVMLHFVNRAGNGHDFTAPRFFSSSRILAGHVMEGEVHLRSGASTSVTLVPAAGRYKVHCSRFFHKQLGMKGEILVQ